MLAEINSVNALIIGATQGIGLGFVKALLQQENVGQVFATYRNSETASELFELQRQHGQSPKMYTG